ncbi:MAG: hypothetical protein ACLFUB_17890 [Cyclobacteriaceae bacterium]
MKYKNIFNSASIFYLCLSLILLFAACSRNTEYGPKEGEEESGISSDSDEREPYGLQPDDLTFNDEQEGQEEGVDDEYPADEDYPRNDVVAGEDNEASEVEYGQADTVYDENQAMYPSDKIQEETNLNSNKPMQLDSEFASVQVKKLYATLNRRKTQLENQIRELENMPGNSEDSSVIQGNIEKLKLYREKLDTEIAKVLSLDEENYEEVLESAQAAMKGSGALMQEKDMRIQQGY